MKHQGSGAERFAKRPDPNVKLVLAFGEDEGVVADTANLLIKAWEKLGPSNVISLDDDEVKREPNTLFDALEAVSLLGEASILRIRTSGEKLFALLKDVLAIAQDTPERIAARVIIQNGSLNTRSKMRTAFEAAPHAAALHVFTDSDDDIAGIVRKYLDERGVAIAPEALSFFVGGLPGHRSLANAEMEKLSLYAHGLGRPVIVADIRDLCETNADESAAAAVTFALAGDPQAAQAEMDRVLDAGLSPITLLRAFEREGMKMLGAHAFGPNATAAMGMKLKPPVWKSEWPAFSARLRRWPMPRLLRLLERLHDIEKLAKTQGPAAEAATRQLFTDLYTAAAQMGQKIY